MDYVNYLFDKLATRGTILLLALMTVIIGSFSLFVWYDQIYLNPERTFWATIDSSLQTSSVTRVVSSDARGQTVNQLQTLSFTPELTVATDVQIESPDNKVDVSTIGFNDADFLRYNAIELQDAEEAAIVADAIGVWATQGEASGSQPELLQESLLASFILFGSLNGDARSIVIDQLRNAYFVDFNTISAFEDNGRPHYRYTVEVTLSEFLPALVEYLRANDQNTLADDIAGAQVIDVVAVDVTVDARARRITKIEANGSIEEIANQGIFVEYERQDTDVTYQELQERLSI